MTTHDKDKIIAAAKEAGIHRRSTPIGTTEMFCWEADIESLYAIAFEAGRQAEREECINILNVNSNSCSEDSITKFILNSNIEAIRARGDRK